MSYSIFKMIKNTKTNETEKCDVIAIVEKEEDARNIVRTLNVLNINDELIPEVREYSYQRDFTLSECKANKDLLGEILGL